MPDYSLGHLTNHVLLRDLNALVAQDRATTASLLAHIGEVEARRLYADAGYSAMFHYCVQELSFSEDMAGMRIRAARLARRFPAVFDAIADGRLNVTALCLLSRPLRGLRGSAARELIAAAEHKTKEAIRIMLAERFPQPDLLPRVRALPESPRCVSSPHVLERVGVQEVSATVDGERTLVAGDEVPTLQAAPASAVPSAEVAIPIPRPASAKVMPLSPARFGLQLTMSAETRDKLRRAQELLGHAVEHGDLATVLDRALDALIEKLERRRFGATDAPRASRPTKSVRHIPAGVRRAVRARDGEQCTFVSDKGRRCEERGALEFDHVKPVARGGETTVANLRLRCRAHNQLEAERAFGAGFMESKRGSSVGGGLSPA